MRTHARITTLIAALAVGALTFAGGTAASANTTGAAATASASPTAVVSSETQDSSGTVDAVDDGNTPDCVVCGAPVIKVVKVSGPSLVSKKFVKHLTGAWAKSSGYTWSASTTATATIDGNLGASAAGASANIGVSASITRSYSISVSIPANSSKFSKLGLASDFNRYYVKSARHQNGKLIPGATWSFGYLNSPTNNQYLTVYYQ